jgi:hypothetical protein
MLSTRASGVAATAMLAVPGASRSLSLRSDSGSLGLWSRYHWPTGVEAFGRPLRWVLEGYHTEFLMAQKTVLGINRITRLGGGVEVDIGRWGLGAFGLKLQRVRLMSIIVTGGDVSGWPFGLRISF